MSTPVLRMGTACQVGAAGRARDRIVRSAGRDDQVYVM
ncbi:hypothetical protein RAJCM14343_2399 [Rhodococcus aetherivorans]|uniref:Uncharacterized protein n=1 Tax=Rhodococcus aetherivorans TaxID=191292 RepID=A0ABQ0YL56_9NOCA|nr:hypothetical protein RAJCM14343_2399 [Rhodococcus aetherivorans]CCW12269.1 hypothetical protein EBESD8_28180 [Rhodococcus aetherivorans]